MYYRVIQKPKKWFKPKKVKKRIVRNPWGVYPENDILSENDDFYGAQWTHYGGVNHTNRDRKGGHVCIWKWSPTYEERKRRNSKSILKEELKEYYENKTIGQEPER